MSDALNSGGRVGLVAIGGSAGALKAYREFLIHLPLNLGLAYVIVQHMGEVTFLRELLQRETAMPVVSVTDGLRPRANAVYINVPRYDLRLAGDSFELRPSEPQSGMKRCVDKFLTSLAESHGKRAVAAIFSGTLWDGALGIRNVKAAGGLTFAQTPPTAAYPGMPQHAIATGCVDLVLAPQEIARMLASKRQSGEI